MNSPDLSLLSRLGWLADTPADFRNALLSRCLVRTAGPGDALYHVGDAAGGLYGVVQGQLGVHGAQHGANPTLVHIAGPGFWTGEFAALTGGARMVSLIARSHVVMVRLPRAELLRLAEADPSAWRYLATLSVQNTARAMAIIGALRRDKATDRLAATLVNLGAELGSGSAVLHLSQDDLGTLARLSRGSVNTALARLEREGLVRRSYSAITLLDRAALAAFEEQA